MSHTVHLSGNFIDLRPLDAEDAAMTLEWRLSARARLLNQGAADVEQQKRWIGARPDDEYNFVICLKDGRGVGMLSLIGVDAVNRRAEPARLLIGEEKLVRGIPAAAEAIQLLYNFAFKQLGLVRLFGTVAADNRGMAKWHDYTGMKREGCLRKHLLLDGELRDVLIFGLLKEEFDTVTAAKLAALVALAGPPSQSDYKKAQLS